MSAERPGTMNRMLEWQPVDWLRYFGLLIWILAAVPLALFPMLTKQPPSTDAMVGWWSGAVLFLLAFLHPCVRLQWRSPTVEADCSACSDVRFGFCGRIFHQDRHRKPVGDGRGGDSAMDAASGIQHWLDDRSGDVFRCPGALYA